MNVANLKSCASRIAPWCLLATITLGPATLRAETIEIGIGTQNTTTNTVTGGVVLKELGILEASYDSHLNGSSVEVSEGTVEAAASQDRYGGTKRGLKSRHAQMIALGGAIGSG